MPTTAEKIESLIRWIHERPQMYVTRAGELDSVLHYLHMVWADLTGRENQFVTARESAKGPIDDQQRGERVQIGAPATDAVLTYWNAIDAALDIQIRCDAWHSHD